MVGGTAHLKAGTGQVPTLTPNPKLDIIDIRRAALEINLKEEIHKACAVDPIRHMAMLVRGPHGELCRIVY